MARGVEGTIGFWGWVLTVPLFLGSFPVHRISLRSFGCALGSLYSRIRWVEPIVAVALVGLVAALVEVAVAAEEVDRPVEDLFAACFSLRGDLAPIAFLVDVD